MELRDRITLGELALVRVVRAADLERRKRLVVDTEIRGRRRRRRVARGRDGGVGCVVTELVEEAIVDALRLARGMTNRLIEALTSYADKLPPFPIEVWFTTPLRRASLAQGRSDFLALYAGQGAPLLRHRRVADLMGELTSSH